MKKIRAYSAAKIFSGDAWLHDHVVIVEKSTITSVIPSRSMPGDVVVQHFPDAILAPAFIDLQIYGAGEKLLAVFPDTDALYKLNDYCRGGGAAYCLPTVATNEYEVFYRAIDAIKAYWKENGEGVLGLHIEGPWINPVKKGAHIESLIHSPTPEQAKTLLEYGKGVIKMITLAPEVCSQEVIDMVLSYDIKIAAGHSNATYAEAINSFTKEITTVTHLYNAMSPLHHRAPGLAGAAMDSKKVMASIIPDGHHVDFAAIRIAKEVMKERLYVITDAVTETTTGPYPHHLSGNKYVSDNILSGSALTMNKAVQNLVEYADIDLGEALRMCSLYPARVMGKEKELGKIENGYKAKMVLLDERNEVLQVIS